MLAIIIPYYKLRFFESTLKSLANQTDKRFKVYIGNDASTEDPTNLLNDFKGQIDFEYIAFTNNLGSKSLVKQWERCIGLSKQEPWLMILGDDDYLEPNVVEEFYNHYPLFNSKTNVVRFASRIDRFELGLFSITYKHPTWEKASDGFYRKYNQLTMSSLSEYIFSLSGYEQFRFHDFPLAWYADDMAWLEFSQNLPIYSINNAVVYFRYSDSNISGRTDNLDIKSKAQYLFYKKIISNKLYLFSRKQKITLLLAFGEVCSANNQLDFFNSFNTLKKLVMQGAFISAAKFLRRAYRAKGSFYVK